MQILRKIDIKNMVVLTVAGIINAFGITMLLSPVNLYDSGISGTSMLFAQITPEYLPLSVFLIIFNIPLFLYGCRKQGRIFTLYSVFTVTVYSVCAWLINNVFIPDVNAASPIAGTDLLLCAIFGGIISGIGSGLAIRGGGAMDGIEVMAVIFAKKIGISEKTFISRLNRGAFGTDEAEIIIKELNLSDPCKIFFASPETCQVTTTN